MKEPGHLQGYDKVPLHPGGVLGRQSDERARLVLRQSDCALSTKGPLGGIGGGDIHAITPYPLCCSPLRMQGDFVVALKVAGFIHPE